MSYGISSDEVAEDYRKALEDLTMNSRYEISNLTVIAKENTEHALAISEALRVHIKRTAPVKKLPAFYVLDSIVKNVGTPYTLFFGRNLYSTFMESYALVDNNTRRKMEEMLKTWKEPVPGSIDTRPVFPIEVTRPIETALIKARTAALQSQQEYARSQPQPLGRVRPPVMGDPYRNTPTPPNGFRPPPFQQTGYNSQAYPQDNGTPPYPQQSYGASQPTVSQQYASPPAWQQQARGFDLSDNSIDTLNSDIANLIAASKVEFAESLQKGLHDGSIQTRLKALLDLQGILQSQKLPPDQIALIRDQVKQLSIAAKPQPPPTPVVRPPPPAPVTVSQAPSQQPSLASLLGGPDALAALLAKAQTVQQVPTPTPPPKAIQPAQPIRSPPPSYMKPQYPLVPSPAPPPTPVTDPNSLLASLRAAGILKPVLPPTSTSNLPPSSLAGSASLPPGFPPPLMTLNQPYVVTGTRSALSEIPNDVQLKPASLKIPRPHLISILYERLGAPCTQCGRRFQSDEEGKKKKTAHMDWHFRIHQRMVEAEKRGQHRSWYVDELDWIKSRETEDEHLASASNGSTVGTGSGAVTNFKAPKQQYVPVPNDPALKNSVCPICQEKFDMQWLDEAQEWVWMDAIKVGDRIYHASCYAEAKKGGSNTPAYSRGTPEPVLGKRKNEEDHMTMRTKVKTESF